MARQLLVLDEVIAMMETVGVPAVHVRRFREQAEMALSAKPRKALDSVTVASGRGQASKRGFVELTIDDTLTQMDAAKAREIGVMLIEAAEAAISDDIFVRLLEDLGVDDAIEQGALLMKLRELRQGTRGVSYPS